MYEGWEREDGFSEPTVLYADDVSLVIDMENRTRAQKRLNICTKWARKTNSAWNVSKCWVLREEGDEDPKVELSGRQIPVV